MLQLPALERTNRSSSGPPGTGPSLLFSTPGDTAGFTVTAVPASQSVTKDLALCECKFQVCSLQKAGTTLHFSKDLLFTKRLTSTRRARVCGFK